MGTHISSFAWLALAYQKIFFKNSQDHFLNL